MVALLSNALPDAYAVLGVDPGAPQSALKAAHRALVRRHHPDLAPPAERGVATRRVQEINVAYGLVRDPQRREAYDRARAMANSPAAADLAAAAGRWAGRWWSRNRSRLARSATQARLAARSSAAAGARAGVDAVGRLLWLALCVLGVGAGWVVAVASQRVLGITGVIAPLAGSLGGLVVGNRYGALLRLRLARYPLPPRGARMELVSVVAAVCLGLWLDTRF